MMLIFITAINYVLAENWLNKDTAPIFAALFSAATALATILITRASKKDELDALLKKSLFERIKELETPLFEKMEALETQNAQQALQLAAQATQIAQQAMKIETLEGKLRDELSRVQALHQELARFRRRNIS